MFLLSDGQLKDEAWLEDINNLLNSGEVPNLFSGDERAQVGEEGGGSGVMWRWPPAWKGGLCAAPRRRAESLPAAEAACPTPSPCKYPEEVPGGAPPPLRPPPPREPQPA